jgi:hypothetical protein
MSALGQEQNRAAVGPTSGLGLEADVRPGKRHFSFVPGADLNCGATVSPIRRIFALLISNGNFADSESARFQRPLASIGRYF